MATDFSQVLMGPHCRSTGASGIGYDRPMPGAGERPIPPSPAQDGLATAGNHGVHPVIDPSAFIAHGAVVLGDVHLGKDASVWYNAVVRGDAERIEVGDEANIQDLSM